MTKTSVSSLRGVLHGALVLAALQATPSAMSAQPTTSPSVVTLGAVLDSVYARAPLVQAARARGVSRARAVLRHAFRNSLIPVVTIVGLQFGAVLTGAVITETIFAWPGIGRLLIQSIGFRDYPLVQGCILLIALTYVGVNLLTDVIYGFLDPRIRYE